VAASGQAGKKIIDLFVAAAVKTENDGIAGPKSVAHHVGAHQHHSPIACQAAMEDIGSCLGWHLGCHRRFGDFLEVEISAEAFFIKGQGFTALAVEIQIGIYLRHFSMSLIDRREGALSGVKLAELSGAEDVQFCQLKGLFATDIGLSL